MDHVIVDCGSCATCKGRGYLRSQDYYAAMRQLFDDVVSGAVPESEFSVRAAKLAESANATCVDCNGHGTGSGEQREVVRPMTDEEEAGHLESKADGAARMKRIEAAQLQREQDLATLADPKAATDEKWAAAARLHGG